MTANSGDMPLTPTAAPGRQLGAFIVALGQDLDGEIYVMTNASNSVKGKSGIVWKLVKK